MKEKQIIDFELLPLSETELISTSFSLYSLIKKVSSVSIYSCLPTGVESASLLGTILPGLTWINGILNAPLQAFCYYNFPDINEEGQIEKSLKSLTLNNIIVKCFGNDLEECSDQLIENRGLDKLAKRIALLYSKVHGNNNLERIKDAHEKLLNWEEKDLELNWRNISEFERESNRLAADHASVKLLEFGKRLSLDTLDLENFWGNDLAQLAELEHRRWCTEKLLLGWLPFTDSKKWDDRKKEIKMQKRHLHLVPYSNLPNEEKDKDFTQVISLPFFEKMGMMD